MTNFLNLDLVLTNVKVLVESTKCIICDHSNTVYMRYSCGHTSCDQCSKISEACLICLTPPQALMPTQPTIDKVLTERANNSLRLLEACQNNFGVDVYRRLRLSDKLKAEKELFPKCIQSPSKYYNKKKSTIQFNDKENIVKFPGENIHLNHHKDKMENSRNYVKQWLQTNDKNIVRKPFIDLNLNDQALRQSTLNNLQQKNVVNNSRVYERKRKANLIDVPNNKWEIENNKFMSPIKKTKHANKVHDNCDDIDSDKDESGIVIDEGSVIVIDDSQTEIDKDKDAWLAVLEAAKNENCLPSTITRSEWSNTQNNLTNNAVLSLEKTNKVPFYKKSYLIDPCKSCIMDSLKDSPTIDTNNISIKVESHSFSTVINISKNVERKNITNKLSTSAQTDISDMNTGVEITSRVPNSVYKKDAIGAISKQPEKAEHLKRVTDLETIIKPSKIKVIEETDSDDYIEDNVVTFQVNADIHQSFDEFKDGVLTQVDSLQEHEKRHRRKPRGWTPTSTDSSEKENFNRNCVKRKKSLKKKCKSNLDRLF